MKKAILTSMAVLAACGGSGSNAALSRSFNYGTPQAPDSSQQAAASSAQSSLSEAASFSTSPNATAGAVVIGFADGLAALALGDASFGLAPRGAGTRGSLREADISACATLTGSTVTFSNCSQSYAGFSESFSGTVSSVAGAVSWNISGTVSGSANGVSVNVAYHQSGNLAVTASKITGSALSDFGGSVSGQGVSVSYGFSTAVVIDLTYQTAPQSCVTGGTVEVKRVWTQKPNGVSGTAYDDAGVKLTWTGCNVVEVAHST